MPKRKVGEIIKRGRIYCIRYYDSRGRRRKESSGSERRADAERLLRKRLQAGDDGVPVDAQIGRVRFGEAASDLINEYTINRRKSLDELERRIAKHLKPFFADQKLTSITATDVRKFVNERQQSLIVSGDGETRKERNVSNGEINRELTALKRIFTLAMQAGKILHRPHIAMLREDNVRAGFFELEQFHSVSARLPESLRPVVTFGYITGWRITSEVLPLQWRQVDMKAGEVRLNAGTTKNGSGRVFPFTDDLRALLNERHRETKELERKHGTIIPWVFYRMVAKGRGGQKQPKPIRSFTKAWHAACVAAGCPGRIPHDLRRTAVRNMVRAGVPERVAMQLSGHKTRSVFERYNIVSPGDLNAAAVRLSGLMGPSTGPLAEMPSESVNQTKVVSLSKSKS